MPAKTQITGEFAKPSDVASRLRIPAARTAELRRMMIENFANRDAIHGVSLKVALEGLVQRTPKTRHQSARSKKK